MSVAVNSTATGVSSSVLTLHRPYRSASGEPVPGTVSVTVAPGTADVAGLPSTVTATLWPVTSGSSFAVMAKLSSVTAIS